MFKVTSIVVLLSLLLAGWLVMTQHPATYLAIRNTIGATLLVTAAHFLLQSAGGPSLVAGAIVQQSAFGSLGMSLGSWLDNRPRMPCCMSVFGIDQLLSWPTLFMFVFCYTGSRWPVRSCGPAGHRKLTCGWLSLPMMYFGMCLAGQYLSPSLKATFGLFPAMHWAMFLGMVAGHLTGTLTQSALSSIGSYLFLKHQNVN